MNTSNKMKSQSNFNLNWSGNVKANPRILFPKNTQQLKTIIIETISMLPSLKIRK